MNITEINYQQSKPYSFKDLELSLSVKIKEVEQYKRDVKRLQEENAKLRYDLKEVAKVHKRILEEDK